MKKDRKNWSVQGEEQEGWCPEIKCRMCFTCSGAVMNQKDQDWEQIMVIHSVDSAVYTAKSSFDGLLSKSSMRAKEIKTVNCQHQGRSLNCWERADFLNTFSFHWVRRDRYGEGKTLKVLLLHVSHDEASGGKVVAQVAFLQQLSHEAFGPAADWEYMA